MRSAIRTASMASSSMLRPVQARALVRPVISGVTVGQQRGYHQKVIDHYENPRNVSALVLWYISGLRSIDRASRPPHWICGTAPQHVQLEIWEWSPATDLGDRLASSTDSGTTSGLDWSVRPRVESERARRFKWRLADSWQCDEAADSSR